MSSRAVALPITRVQSSQLFGIALLATAVAGVSFAIVRSPWVAAGVVLGAAILAIALMAPLALVALMLIIGPFDLSFVTGGFKSLLPEMGGLDMNGIRLIGATAGFLAFIMVEKRAVRAAFGPMGRMWVVFLLFAGGTIAMSPDRIEGARLLLKLAYPFLTFLIVIGLADSRDRIDLLMTYTLAAAAIIGLVINPLMAANGGYRVEADGIKRIGGLGLGDNPFAFYVTAMLFVAFSRFVLRQQLRYLVLSAVLVIWVALTVTRIAALASVVGLLVIGALGAIATGNRKVLVLALGAAFIGGFILLPKVLLRSFGFMPTPGELFALMRDPAALYQSINWQGRQLLWAILWGAFITSPIIGLGLGASAWVIHASFPDQHVKVAHNEYMRLATDTGLLGVALFAAAVITWLVVVVRLSIRGNRDVREFAFPAVAVIMAWALISVTDNPFDYYNTFTQYIGFLVAGAVVVQTTRQDDTVASAA